MSLHESDAAGSRGLARRLNLFDATMIVMGGIVGSGIFINPYVVARQVHTPFLILGAWLAGGAVALAGAFVYAELAARRPEVGGQYAYLREAFHPGVAFLFRTGEAKHFSLPEAARVCGGLWQRRCGRACEVPGFSTARRPPGTRHRPAA